jgi:hypothetical protein
VVLGLWQPPIGDSEVFGCDPEEGRLGEVEEGRSNHTLINHTVFPRKRSKVEKNKTKIEMKLSTGCGRAPLKS